MRAAEILRLVSGALQDLEPGMESRWPWTGGDDGAVGLLDFMNAAVQSVALQRPDVCAVTESILLEPGMRQRLPRRNIHGATRDARFLIELIRNMGTDGGHPGPSISSVSAALLMAWARASHESPTVENYAYDRVTSPNVFFVYPAVPECPDVWVEATYSAAPETVISPEQEFPLPAEYAEAVQHHMLASVLGGDNESGNVSRATYHMQLYSAAMGIKLQVDAGWPKARSSAPAGGTA